MTFIHAKAYRVIKTARTEKSINDAVREGFWPLVKKVERSPVIQTKFAVYQNRNTGEIEVVGDYRCRREPEFDVVIDWTKYYPYSFPGPYAAYLIPKDVEVGERVLLEDVIEDLIGSRWNQGSCYRLKTCFAVWNGNDFDLEYDPESSPRHFIG
jgi:hypothetical protein